MFQLTRKRKHKQAENHWLDRDSIRALHQHCFLVFTAAMHKPSFSNADKTFCGLW